MQTIIIIIIIIPNLALVPTEMLIAPQQFGMTTFPIEHANNFQAVTVP